MKKEIMTPQEYADWLFRTMYEVRTVAASDVSKYFAKQSALITVKELIRCAPYGLYDSLTGEPDPDTVEYFWIVKEELEKI